MPIRYDTEAEKQDLIEFWKFKKERLQQKYEEEIRKIEDNLHSLQEISNADTYKETANISEQVSNSVRRIIPYMNGWRGKITNVLDER